MIRSMRGFTLTEIVVALMVTGVALGLFTTLFAHNWSAYEDKIKRANLWSEANQFFEAASMEGRNSRLIEVTNTATAKTATFTNALDNSQIIFTLTDAGALTRTKNTETKIYSTNALFDESSFLMNGKNLSINLRLRESVLGRAIHINASTEVLPRN